MGGRQSSVRRRGGSYQFDFYYRGVRCRETLRLAPTKANEAFARNKMACINHEIAVGTFNYSKHFPGSARAVVVGAVPNRKLTAAFDFFLQASRRTCAPSTLKGYRSAIEYHLRPTFGDRYLAELTADHVKGWLGTLSISHKRINNVLIPLRSVMGDAFADGLIERNPLLRIKNLSNRLEEPEPFSPREMNAILEACPGQAANFFQFAFWTGLRTSELIALEWQDIDWRKEIARVRRAFVLRQTKLPKTASGERDVKLLPPALTALKAQKPFTFLAGQRVFWNPRTSLPWETDAEIRKTAWTPALKRAGVAYRNPYQTRHTYASMMLSAGENPMWVARQMGHKDWGMLRKRYGRWIPELDASAGSKIMALWAPDGHQVAPSG